MESLRSAPLSVRELIWELSEVEDALRQARRRERGHGPSAIVEPDVADLVHREQVLVHELRRRRARAQPGGWRPGRSERSR
ncbi:hypothetical protein [Segeticoccus rhizosphaerae]|jgi:hypothetical protein|uniref:hypothetical protein n=1 Tax=Segeticoccus rhizosphaerae TaxID=1104777 RepID=UPI0010BFFF70|nr:MULTISPECIES: hypothetical protein [Intrasporangiaceae]